MKKYLVTGGAGFIGSNIVKKILANGDFVRVADNFSTGRRENINEFVSNPNFELLKCNLAELEAARTAVKGMHIVMHQAALPSVQRSVDDPIASNNANVTATLNTLIAARDEKIERFVYASSSSVYGNNPEMPKKEDFPIRPESPYALTKYVGERYCQLFWNIYKLPTICLRYFNVFGPKQDPNSQYSAVIPNFIKVILEGRGPVIFGDGEQSRDFTFVDNVVSANLLAAGATQGFGEVFNVACGEKISLNEIIKLLQVSIGKEVTVKYGKDRVGDVKHSLADISKAKKIIKYSPVVTFEEGLKRTIEWYKG